MLQDSSDDVRHPSLGRMNPEHLLLRYCGDIEEQIRSAGSRRQAARVIEVACDALERECPSEIVQSFLKRYVHDLFNRYWHR